MQKSTLRTARLHNPTQKIFKKCYRYGCRWKMWLLYYGSKHNLLLDTPLADNEISDWYDVKLGGVIVKRKRSFFIIICFALLLLWLLYFFWTWGGNDNNKKLLPIDEIAEKWHGKQDLLSTGETKEIIIPGF